MTCSTTFHIALTLTFALVAHSCLPNLCLPDRSFQLHTAHDKGCCRFLNMYDSRSDWHGSKSRLLCSCFFGSGICSSPYHEQCELETIDQEDIDQVGMNDQSKSQSESNMKLGRACQMLQQSCYDLLTWSMSTWSIVSNSHCSW